MPSIESLYQTNVEATYLGVAKSILVVVHIQAGQELLRGFSAVHKLVIWDGLWIQDAISVVVKGEHPLYDVTECVTVFT